MVIGHQKQWEFLKRKFELNQLSHAYLFTGAEGIGKKLFAKEFSELIGCKFPDLMIVSEANKKDEKFGDGGEIKISQIREVQNFLSYKSYNGGFKIVIIDEAEKMNLEAQSCFLKTLEEPKGQTILFLVSSKPDMLLPTIFSRCQTVKFFKPKNLPENSEKSAREQELLKGLLVVIGADLAEKFKYVKAIDFEKQSASEIVDVLQRYLRHLLLLKIGLPAKAGTEKSSAFFDKYTVSKIKEIIKLTEEINFKITTTNANPKLALEVLLMQI